MIKNRAIVLGCISAFIVIGGIIMSILLYQMLRNIVDGHRNYSSDGSNISVLTEASGPVWALGLLYVVPGVLGFISAFCQKKWLYIVTAIFSIIPLLIMGLLFVVAGFALIAFIIAFGAVSELCRDSPDGCQCRTEDEYSYEYKSTPFTTCEYFSSFTALAIAMFIFIILTWIALLGQFILVCYYACRSQPSSQGTVYTPSQQPMIQMHSNHPPQYPPPGYAYPPPQQQYYDDPPQSKA